MTTYPCVLCLILYALANVCCQVSSIPPTCYPFNPFYINGTQNASELRCPDRCECRYCPLNEHGETSLKYSHNVYCTNLEIKDLPPKDTVPTDVFYYHLEHNDISTIKNDSFNTSNTLEFLHLNDNELEYTGIGNSSFSGLKKLRYLSLDGNNRLGKLLKHWFTDMVSLEDLHASRCGLSMIDNDIFKNCKNLRKLYLSSNNIAVLPTTLLKNLRSLMYIFIDNNKLSLIPNQAFKGSNNLLKIVINDNLLHTISEKVGIQNLTNLKLLNVGYNKFSCDCDLVWFRNWINATNVTIEDLDNTKCYTNKNTKVYHNILDFDTNKLGHRCSKLVRILKMVIPPVACAVFLMVLVSLLYSYRYDIRYWNQKRLLRKQYQQLDNQGPPPINGENILYDAFVSYNSKDQEWVLKVLQPSLEERNFKLCVDYQDFLPGEAVVKNIANAVKYSRKVILVVSKNFAKSEWCYFELEMARMRMFEKQEDILVVILLENVPARGMPILLHKVLTEKTYIEWEEHGNRQGLFWAKLEAALLSPNCHRDRLLEPPV